MVESSAGLLPRIAIIDTGLDHIHSFYQGKLESFFSVTRHGTVEESSVCDEHGHGTAIAYIINKHVQFYTLRVYKTFDEQLRTNSERLITALKHVQSWRPHIVNLSLGMLNRNNLAEIKQVCEELVNQGTIIVAAASETEQIPCWPADFPFVIKVRSSNETIPTYIYYEGRPITIVTYSSRQRVAWKNGQYSLGYGNSFACAKMTGIIASMLLSSPSCNIELALKQNALSCHWNESSISKSCLLDLSAIKSVALFPYNKEMHSLIRFRDMLPFDIKSVCDFPFSKRIGMDAGEAIGVEPCGIIVQSKFQSILDSGVDTVILGDLSEISALHQRDYISKYVHQCYAYNKSVISIETLPRTKELLLKEEAHNNQFMCCTSQINPEYSKRPPNLPITPIVIAVMGTGPKTGKFTAQLLLKQYLSEVGYITKNVCTEPQAFLFGFPSLPLGNLNLLDIIPLDKQIDYLQNSIIEQTLDNPEVIIIGGQSGVVPYSSKTIAGYNALSSQIVLLASKPDGILLCINPNDSADYINRTVAAIEAFGYGKVLACIMSDLSKEKMLKNNIYYNVDTHISVDQLDELCLALEERTGIPTLHLQSTAGITKCILILQQTFSP